MILHHPLQISPCMLYCLISFLLFHSHSICLHVSTLHSAIPPLTLNLVNSSQVPNICASHLMLILHPLLYHTYTLTPHAVPSHYTIYTIIINHSTCSLYNISHSQLTASHLLDTNTHIQPISHRLCSKSLGHITFPSNAFHSF